MITFLASCVFGPTALAATMAFAQPSVVKRPGGDPAQPQVLAGPAFELPVDVLTAEPIEIGEPVAGLPYTADMTTEVAHELADGNRIERRSSSTIARDSRGRVRREQQLSAIGPFPVQGDVRIVTISDPVAGLHYSLDPARKVALRMPLPVLAEAPLPAPPHDRVLFAAPPEAVEPEVQKQPLGSKMLEGVRVEGTRYSMTLSAGAIGNQRPLTVVTERWYSPELKVVVLSSRVDPRFGATTYRLSNILRSEPSPELFQVPPDYKVETPPLRIVRTPEF